MLLAIGIGVLFYFILTSSAKEFYGGQIKKIKKLPFTECKNICDGYYEKCLIDNRVTGDTEWCRRRFKESCVSECYYSNYHRM